jgi:hypothetical protein
VSPVLLAASLGEQLLSGLATAIPASILTVVVSWQAILRRKVEARVEAQIAYEYAREKGRFDDELQRRRELVMRVLEKEMLERLDEIMACAYRARNAVRELATLDASADGRTQLLEQIAAEGRTFQTQIMENRIRLTALSSFEAAHALKNALLAVVRAERAGDRDELADSAALVESSFGRFDGAIGQVLAATPS